MKKLMLLTISLGFLNSPLSFAKAIVPIDTSKSSSQVNTQSAEVPKSEEIDSIKSYRKSRNYVNSTEWEEQFMILKGFKLGVALVPQGLSIGNANNHLKLNSGALTGLEFGLAHIPKNGVSGPFWGMASVGYKSRFYVVSSTFSEDPMIGTKQFSAGAIDFDVTYSYNSDLYLFAGLNIPRFSFDRQAKNLDFDSRIGGNVGAGYEIAKDWAVELQFTKHNFELISKTTSTVFGYSFTTEDKLGELSYTLTNLAVTYTF
ncbi:MAG: hypothetical protein HOO06_06430 [Bdellovibrionaceae bacterium]|nr:hypothetical protein [Pseudobdellovibrionaceae bacterium]